MPVTKSCNMQTNVLSGSNLISCSTGPTDRDFCRNKKIILLLSTKNEIKFFCRNFAKISLPSSNYNWNIAIALTTIADNDLTK